MKKQDDELTVAMVAQPYVTKQTVPWEVSEDLAMSEGNLETTYCGDVIGDDVQLWNRKQVTWVRLNLTGEKHRTKDLKT